MAHKKSKQRERQIGKKQPAKKHLSNPKYRSTIWTIIIVVILLIFFIINNTRSLPEQGPYPPNYNAATERGPDTVINKKLQMDTHINDLK